MQHIFNKIIVRRFYLQHAGFFFVLFYFLFGVVDSGNLLYYHLGLLNGFLHHYGFLALVLLSWALYNTILCTGYMMKLLQLPEYTFLYTTIGSLDKNARRRLWWRLQAGMYLPVIIYGAIAIVYACTKQLYAQAAIIAVFNIAMCIWPAALYERKLWQPDVFFFTGGLQRWLNKHFTKPPFTWFIYEMFTRFPRRIILVKVYSLGILWLTFFLMEQGSDFDLRALQIGIICTALVHMQLMSHQRAFEEIYTEFMRNLPIPLWQHYGRLLATWCLLYLPELIMITVNANTKTNVQGLLIAAAMGFSLLVLFRTILYYPKVNAEIHLRYLLVIAFIDIFLVLGHYEWPAILAMQAAAALIFFNKSRVYEPYIETE
ncbi:hypothetical protein [Chitinophaga vietnamensis]|uniref:hypothetical protein n=1 Tax=Chitinophaga vietnamensis TaxID=2593957 RepID=UPI00117808A8|nr:hypothetical protein [Chitinophaga vietnamensis]